MKKKLLTAMMVLLVGLNTGCELDDVVSLAIDAYSWSNGGGSSSGGDWNYGRWYADEFILGY